MPPQSQSSQPAAILDAWTALEVLSPQPFRRPEDLAGGDRGMLAGLAEGKLPWEGAGTRERPDRRVFYQVLLGTLDYGAAIERLVARYTDSRAERPVPRGEVVLAAVTVTREGLFVDTPAATVASFAWGLPRALAGDLTTLAGWRDEEESLLADLDDILRGSEDDEIPVCLTSLGLAAAHAFLVKRLGLPEDLVRPPRFAVRVHLPLKSSMNPEPLLLNSFFLGDLGCAKGLLQGGRPPRNLLLYLGARKPPAPSDLLRAAAAVDAAVAPKATPPARWPGRGRPGLVLLQQAAVNLAVGELKTGGILGINGPPGTGKTTLLRDLLAAAVTRRAEVMAGIKNPAAAFIPSGEKLKMGEAWLQLYRLDPRLQGFEMVVASSNNKAVENVSAELPALQAVAEDAADLRYFKTLSDALLDRDTWGLCAAVLGNASNRSRFRNTFWWDPDIGLSTYLAEAAGTPQILEVVDPQTKVRTARPPRIVTAENPPRTPQEALRRWRAACDAFKKALSASRSMLDAAEKLHAVASTPSLGRRGKRKLQAARDRLGERLLDAAFWERPHAERQRTSPWLTEEDQRLRDRVFVAAMALHRAFLDAAAKPLRHNLGVLMSLLAGRTLPDDEKRALLPDLWASLFLVVPLVSTTFASVERMFGELPPEKLGWLFVDEAGQAVPQAAVGAVFRTRRAVLVGDPVQIEPVVTLPDRFTQAVCRHFGVDPNRFNAPEASAQALADAASPYLAEIEGRRGARTIGVPLLVHRRCSQPMFGIANSVAYENLMVDAKGGAGPSPIGDLLGPSRWIDVRGTAEEKWSPEEGWEVLNLLRPFAALPVAAPPDLYIITPFVTVAARLRRLIEDSGVLRWTAEPRRWIHERIGTVHTVQGREAEAVILVLGAPAPQQTGARGWAGGRPNLLNVAVTRAKERLYVVGNRELWRGAGVFRELDSGLE